MFLSVLCWARCPCLLPKLKNYDQRHKEADPKTNRYKHIRPVIMTRKFCVPFLSETFWFSSSDKLISYPNGLVRSYPWLIPARAITGYQFLSTDRPLVHNTVTASKFGAVTPTDCEIITRTRSDNIAVAVHQFIFLMITDFFRQISTHYLTEWSDPIDFGHKQRFYLDPPTIGEVHNKTDRWLFPVETLGHSVTAAQSSGTGSIFIHLSPRTCFLFIPTMSSAPENVVLL